MTPTGGDLILYTFNRPARSVPADPAAGMTYPTARFTVLTARATLPQVFLVLRLLRAQLF